MSNFASEIDLLEELSAHDDLVRRCVRGDIEFREFVRLYDDFWWRFALDGHESDSAEQSWNVTLIGFSYTGRSRRR